MLDYKTEALNRVREYAITKLPEYQAIVEDFCKQSEVDVVTLINQMRVSKFSIPGVWMKLYVLVM